MFLFNTPRRDAMTKLAVDKTYPTMVGL